AGDQRRARGARARGMGNWPHNRGRRTPQAEGRHIGSNFPRQPMRGRPWSWITGRPRLTDGLIVGFNLLVGIVGLIGTFYRHSLIAALIAAAVLQASSLCSPPTHPVA